MVTGPKRLYLDLDGVLTRMIEESFEFHGVADPFLDEKNLGRYDISGMVGMSREAYYGPLGEEFWANVGPYDWLPDLLAMVEDRFGENICIATSPIATRGCYEGKKRWIEKHLPDYHRGRRYKVGHPKWFGAGPACYLLDDSDTNCQKFREWGGNSLLFPRNWNSNHRYANVPLDWLEGALAAAEV